MYAFTASPTYDPAVNRISPFAAVSSAEPAVEGFSPPATHPMSDALWMIKTQKTRTNTGNQVFHHRYDP
jgi:hypothetical protein